MGALQKTAQRTGPASEPAAALTVAMPREGEVFSDGELHARFGVPMQGGIRVSQENRCIVLVDHSCEGSEQRSADRGARILYTGQDSERTGVYDQEMSGGNLALSRSKGEGYAVLYFTEEGGRWAFNSRVECDSHEFELETRWGGQPRVLIKFNLLVVGIDTPVLRKHTSSIDSTNDHIKSAARNAADERARIEAIDSPPLAPEEISAIKRFFAGPEPGTISNEEFLSIVTDGKKLEDRIQYLNS